MFLSWNDVRRKLKDVLAEDPDEGNIDSITEDGVFLILLDRRAA
jgi:hypothetical protein